MITAFSFVNPVFYALGADQLTAFSATRAYHSGTVLPPARSRFAYCIFHQVEQYLYQYEEF